MLQMHEVSLNIYSPLIPRCSQGCRTNEKIFFLYPVWVTTSKKDVKKYPVCQVIAKTSFTQLCFKQLLPVFARFEVTVAALLCTCHNSIHEQYTALLILAVHLHNFKLICFLVICLAVLRVWWWGIIHSLAKPQWNGTPQGLATPTFCIRTVFRSTLILFLFFILTLLISTLSSLLQTLPWIFCKEWFLFWDDSN